MDNISSNVTTAVCKSLQSIGLSPRKEHQIENAIAIQVQSSGPEYLLARLSDLNDWRKMHMRGEVKYHPEWHAYKDHKGCCIPTDPIGSQLWPLKDKAFFACLGALRKSVSLAIPSEKQLTKWLEGVRCENKSDEKRLGCNCPKSNLAILEKRLSQKWSGRPWFNVSDISGINIPGSGKFMKVRVDKKTCKKESLSLLSAYGFSVSTTPLFIWQFLEDINAPTRMSEGIDCPTELVGSLSEVIDSKLSNYMLQDEAMMGSSILDDDSYLKARAYRNANLGFLHSVGNIGFLEQEGGKLRTVANPNRLVQYVNVPLGEVLSDLAYSRPEVFVKDQEGGMLWAQHKLREGKSLSSFDMSSATDRLDYSKWLHEYFKLAYDNSNEFPLLVRSLELFEDTSSANWSIPGHVADLCGIVGNEIGWTVGQPLGLRPSFPILTLMNASFASEAVKQIDGRRSHGHFACVGDDLIIETKYADAYMAKVASFNGKINNEKTLVSDKYAEFCSHLVTRSTYYPLKPRFIMEVDGSFQNVEKFTTSGLHPKVPAWTYALHESVAKYHLDGFNTIKFSNSTTPKPLMERLGVNTLIEAIKPASQDTEKVSLQTLYLRAEEEREKGKMPIVKDLGTSYASSAYPKFGGKETKPTIKERYDKIFKDFNYDILGTISTDQSTSVEIPIKKEWDFRKATYSKPVSEARQAKDVCKTLDSIETFVTGPLVESKTVVKGVETTILVDTSPEVPEVTLSYHPTSSNREDTKAYHAGNDTTEDGCPKVSLRNEKIAWQIKKAQEKFGYLSFPDDDIGSRDDEFDR